MDREPLESPDVILARLRWISRVEDAAVLVVIAGGVLALFYLAYIFQTLMAA